MTPEVKEKDLISKIEEFDRFSSLKSKFPGIKLHCKQT